MATIHWVTLCATAVALGASAESPPARVSAGNAPPGRLISILADGEGTGGGGPAPEPSPSPPDPSKCLDASPMDLQVSLTVFGLLGVGASEDRQVPMEVLERARQWVIEAIMRTMLDDHHYKSTGNEAATGVRRARTEAPKEQPSASVRVIQPFEEDTELADGDVDQRSAFLRTRWDYRFPSLPLCDAAEFAYRLCDRYPSDTKEFLASVLRSLDMAKLYPIQAIEIASQERRDLMSFLHLSVSLINAQGQQIDGHGCNSEQRRADSEEGFFFLPPCPTDSIACYQNTESEGLCTDEEQKRFGVCKCSIGFKGELTLPSMSAGGSFSGTCTKAPGYCNPGPEGVEGSWELEKAVDHSKRPAGTVGETVRPVCLEGFYPSGLATCAVVSKTEGRYVPDRFCEALLGARPIIPDCALPVGDFLSKGCDTCHAIDDSQPLSKQRCDCEVSCAPGFKEKGRAGPHPRCSLKGFTCPEKLRWDDKNGHCLEEATGERTQDFCCGEAWQQIPNSPDTKQLAMKPPEQLTVVDSCAAIKRISVCYNSAEIIDGNMSACCWRQTGWAGNGTQCAPEGQEEFGTVDLLPGQCAIERLVPLAEWKGLPQCVAKCHIPVIDHGRHSHCDDCVPGEDQEACPCTVECQQGFWHLGGGPIGHRTCDGTRSFGEPPMCRHAPEPPKCPPLEAPLVASNGCKDCRGGLDGCRCRVTCGAGHLLARDSAHPEGDKECVSQPRAVNTGKPCQEISTAEECLNHKEEHEAGSPAAPCCWRAEGFGTGGPRCVALGSALIQKGMLPDGYSGEGPITGCAKLEEGQWQQLPTCLPVCDAAAHFNGPGVVATSCQACFAGQECPECDVQCAEGYIRFGGGETGNYKCSEQLQFGPPPVCRKPEAGEEGGQAPPCEVPVVKDADVRQCSGCMAGDSEGCSCEVQCLPRFKNVLQDVPVGPKKCHKVPAANLAPVDDCGQAVDEVSCTRQTQAGSACCWFPADGGAGAQGRCLARGSKDMTVAPASCARAFVASWDPMPQCDPLCETAPLSLDQQRNLRRDLLAGCEDCVAGQPCACEAICDALSVRVGGGAEGARSCTSTNLRFEDAPLCWRRPPPPRCYEAVEGALDAASLVFTGPGCAGCEAGQEGCICNVQCASGYKGVAGPDEGDKACKVQQIGIEVDKCDAAGVDCLNSKEKDGTPCCSRASGFGEDGKHGTCLRQGDARISLTTPPDSCARTSEGRWEPLPECKALCIWTGSQFIIPGPSCNTCFRDPQFGACDCQVTCRGGSGNDDESWGPAPWALTCNKETGLFERYPNCVPARTTTERLCARPTDEDGSRVVAPGCASCSNQNGAACACEVRCAPNHKLMGGEVGSRSCLEGQYDCPRDTKWVEERRVCLDAADDHVVDLACCPEFVYRGVEGIQPDETADCPTYTTKDDCLFEVEAGKKRACCFQEKGFGTASDAPKCVAAGSDKIGPWSETTSPANACWNRPAVSSAYWDKEMPTCSRRCVDIFAPLGAVIQASKCDDCAAADPSCECTASCADGAAYYGGPPQGPKACVLAPGTSAPAFERPPVCAKLAERPLECPRPQGDGMVVIGCNGCSALSTGPVAGCSCRVQCERGFLPEGGRDTIGEKSCQQVPMELTERPCMELSGEENKDACLSSHQKNSAGELMPCCYHQKGFARRDETTLATCAVKGDPGVFQAPQACAVPFQPTFTPQLPSCKRECTNTFDPITTQITGCQNCFLGGSCTCTVQCRANLEYKGGGPLGDRTCSEDDSALTKASFGAPPLCGQPEPVGVCDAMDTPSHRLSQACLYCELDKPCSCRATCHTGFAWDGNAESPEGQIKCASEPRPPEEGKCESYTDLSTCVAHLEGSNACCWQLSEVAGRGSCYPMGDPRFVRMPVQCAVTRIPKWKVLPSCVPVCKFPDPPVGESRIKTALRYVEVDGCDKCAPGRPCPDCFVTCRDGKDRFGGGPVGNRMCNAGPSDDAAAGYFQPKPLCWQEELDPICPKPLNGDAFSGPRGLAPDAGISFSGCEKCRANGRADCCWMSCAANYQLVGGGSRDRGNVLCEQLPTSPYAPREDQPCSAHQTEEACAAAVEWADAEKTTPTPCCWRSDGFLDGVRCAGKGSKAITLGLLPDADGSAFKCAPMKQAAYSKAPVCEPTCTNIFRAATAVRAQGCDNCLAWPGTYEALQVLSIYAEPSSSASTAGTYKQGEQFEVDKVAPRHRNEKFVWGRVGEGKWVQIVYAQTGDELAKKVGSKDCTCSATCAASYRLMRDSGQPEGARVCRLNYNTNAVSFAAAPDCALACPNPDHDRGTRLITGGCAGDSPPCLVGEASCQCRVDCSPGNVRVGGGQPGRQTCSRIGSTLQAQYLQLPNCNPQCQPPNNQGGALVVDRCSARCDAQDNMRPDPDCRCEVRCAAGFRRTAGAPEGTFRCVFVPGDANTPARAEWRHQSWQEPAPRGMPLCIVEFWVNVVNAQTDDNLRGVSVTLYTDTRRKTVHEVRVTDSDGMVHFAVDFPTMEFLIQAEDYMPMHRTVARSEVCMDPRNCGVKISLAKQLSEGELIVREDQCLLSSKERGRFEFQAVLSWGAPNMMEDLDIWARYFDCGNDVERRFGCAVDQNPTFIEQNWDRWTCGRHEFTTDAVRLVERDACTARVCGTTQNGRATMVDRHGVPICGTMHNNGFPKWVTYESRMVKNLHKRVRGRGRGSQVVVEESLQADGANRPKWPSDNFMALDVDAIRGYGPETVTFKHVPPGTYQVVVTKFSQESRSIDFGNPRIRVTIGSNAVFECRIRETCTRGAQMWNAVNIRVSDERYNSVEKVWTYRIQILDSEDNMQRVARSSIPTTGNRVEIASRFRGLFSGWDRAHYYEWLRRPLRGDTSQQVIDASCFGECDIEQGMSPELRNCIPRLTQVLRARGFNISEAALSGGDAFNV